MLCPAYTLIKHWKYSIDTHHANQVCGYAQTVVICQGHIHVFVQYPFRLAVCSRFRRFLKVFELN